MDSQQKQQKKKALSAYNPQVDYSGILKYLSAHPGLAVFALYAVIAISGFIYLITFYNKFDLEIINYLEITDILVAGIKDPTVLLMVFFSFLLVALIVLTTKLLAPFNAWFDRKVGAGRWRFLVYLIGYKSHRSFWFGMFFALLIYFVLFISIHSKNKAKGIIEKRQQQISVQSAATDGSKHTYSLLGTSINYVFIFDHETQMPLILPLESVTSLQPVIVKKQKIEAAVKEEESLPSPEQIDN